MINPSFIPQDQIVFVSLGGAGEIGMNMYLYGYRGKWLMIDCGLTFKDDSIPVVETILPDPTFIRERNTDLVGIIITHAHEDHLGAVPWLWPQLRCAVYATPFAAVLLGSKLAEVGLERIVPLYSITAGEQLTLGPFKIELIALTHSIPEPTAVILRTPVGTILHSGDWKFDQAPLVGEKVNVALLKRLGTEGIMAMVSDSTNVFVDQPSGSESDVRVSLIRLFSDVKGCIFVTCFASNVARLESIALAAATNNRYVALIGRSLWRIVSVARQSGYLLGLQFYTAEDVSALPRDRILYICTGSQGESSSSIVRIAMLHHPHIQLGYDDMVVFSSRIIPGNERVIGRLHNQLIRLGAKVITERDCFVHVSGHPGRAEMLEMYRLICPRFLVPMHGEVCHLVSHAELARTCGIMAIAIENGQMITLGPSKPAFIGTVPSGRMAVDGYRIISFDSRVVRSRKRMMFNGIAVLTIVVDENGQLLREPQLTATGLLNPDQEEDEVHAIITAVREVVSQLSETERRNDSLMCEAIRLAIRHSCKENLGKKPLTAVHLVRL